MIGPPALAPPTLMDFTLCLTHACNLRCDYCYAGLKTSRRMEWETAKRAIDFALGHAATEAKLTRKAPAPCQIGYFGGEPLLEWDLLCRSADYAIAEAARLGIPLKKTVTTNMTLLDGERADWLREREFYVGLSLDGNAAMHDALRCHPGGRGSHAECAPALAFYRGPEANAEVIVVVDPRNVAHLADSVAWLISEDIRRISLNPNFYHEWTDEALDLWRDQYERVADHYAETFRNGKPINLNVLDGKIRLHVKEGYAACDKCGFGSNEIAIAASGNIYPCERIVADDDNEAMRIGNVFDGFDNARRADLVAKRGNLTPECGDCPVRSRCMNWCSCINYATTGAINLVSGAVCFHEKLAIAEADRVAGTLFAEKNPSFLATFYG